MFVLVTEQGGNGKLPFPAQAICVETSQAEQTLGLGDSAAYMVV